MKVIKAYPPNFGEIARHFPVKGKPGILYAWGDRIYNPSGVKITPWIRAHEELHGKRQAEVDQEQGFGDPVAPNWHWWRRYIREPSFRLAEELLAHRVEWEAFQFHNRDAWPPHHERYLKSIAERLSSPLYGSLISLEEARREIVR